MTKIKVEFLGGLDTIFEKKRSYDLDVPAKEDGSAFTIKDLLDYLVANLIKNPNDVEVFIEDDSVRPGIITLINDADWELEGELEYEIEAGDVISFTSTLHGG